MSAFVKIPLQLLILLTGVLVFVYYLFVQPPMLFKPVQVEEVRESARAAEYATLEREFEHRFAERREAASALVEARAGGSQTAVRAAADAFREAEAGVLAIRSRAADVVKEVTQDRTYNDVNYVFPTFVTTQLPTGLVGILIAAIFAAAMSSIAAELNSLSTATVIDIYRRHVKPEASESHYLFVSKAATAFWALFACVVATYAAGLGSLIEVVNQFGSFFYGSLLGVFALAIGMRRATGTGAFVGLIAGLTAVSLVAFGEATGDISFLWHNVIGFVGVLVVGGAVSLFTGGAGSRSAGPA
jgi:Na+(H+)/acetate symporter ActP